MDPKIKIGRTVDGGLETSVVIDSAMIDYLCARVPETIIRCLTERIADEIVATKKQEMLARIPLDSIINQAVAEVVRRIAEVK